MECILPGRYFNGPGHATSHSITVGTIFQDHASRYVYAHLQESTTDQENRKRIGRYLLKTKERGLIINPNEDCQLKCFVDADFSGLWKVEDPEDKKSATSRTGFVLTYAGIPIMLCSKFQSLIAFSTTEAENMALSQSMRELLPTQELLRDLSRAFQLGPHNDPKFASTVFEDNNSALELAKCPRMRPRTKHIAVKYHFFRDHVQNGNINIEHICTNIQVADILTKLLPRPAFESLRHLMVGW